MEIIFIGLLLIIAIGMILWYLDHCSHEWEVEEKFEIVNSYTKTVSGMYYIMKCTKCGCLKKKRF